jgi:putative YhbY family RNA-binding protein
MPDLSPAQRRALRARAHHLDPVVAIGQHGLTPAVLREIDVALTAHELIKVRVHGDDRDARAALQDAICAALDAAPVQHLGKLLVLWRPNPEKAAAAGKPRQKARAREPAKPEARSADAARRRKAPSGVPRASLPRRRRART